MSLLSILYRWKAKLSLSIIDHGLFSGANFMLNILLARWLIPFEYGIFGIAFSIFLFVSGFHYALILEPMSVIGAAHHSDNLDRYLGRAIWAHAGVTLISSILLLLTSLVMFVKKSVFAFPFLGLTIAVPLILSFWLFRQICYLRTRPNVALRGSVLYAIFLFWGLALLHSRNMLTPVRALLIMSCAGIGASSIFWNYLDIKIPSFSLRDFKVASRDIFRENWHYGKWVIGSALVNWLSIVVYLPLVGFLIGLSQAGSFKAMQNTMMPLQKTFVALAFLFIPWLSREKMVRDKLYLRRNISRFVTVSAFSSLCYVAIVILFGLVIVKFLYGEGCYVDFLWLLPYLGAIAVIGSIAQGLYIGLKVLQRPDAIFWSQGVGAVFTLTVSLYLVAKLKIYGAVLGLLLSVMLITIMLVSFFLKYLKIHEQQL